jgi:hypothetical protein
LDQITYENWWRLHVRLACGGELSAEERATYEAGRGKLEHEESFQEATEAKRARLELARLEQEHAQLERQRRQLEVEIAQLESRLSEPTRQFLNVGD